MEPLSKAGDLGRLAAVYTHSKPSKAKHSKAKQCNATAVLGKVTDCCLSDHPSWKQCSQADCAHRLGQSSHPHGTMRYRHQVPMQEFGSC